MSRDRRAVPFKKLALGLAPIAALTLAVPAIAHATSSSTAPVATTAAHVSKAAESGSSTARLVRQPLKVGLLATITAKSAHAEQVEDLLTDAVALANKEAGTTVWYSFQLSSKKFGIFDAFGGDAARQAHLKGKIAKALTTRPGTDLLAEPITIRPVDVLGAKRTAQAATDCPGKSLKVGLLAGITAKRAHSGVVEDLLTKAVALANKEAGTTVWYSFKVSPTKFGIFDAFGSNAARQAHLNGKIAKALTTSPGTNLLSRPLDIQKVDILAAKNG